MDKQKIFWVILSVSVFVVVVLVVGVFLLKQKPADVAATTQTVSPLSDTGTKIYEYGQEKPQTPALETKPNEPEVMKFVIGDNTAKQAPPETVPLALPKPVAEKPLPQMTPVVKPVPAKPAPEKPAPRKASPPKPVKTVEYWIQTGSYKSQSKAEDLGKLLDDKGLSARVFSYAARNDTYFRVRIGPYTNKNEADKFLSIVKQIQGLESSYVSSVSATRTLD